MSGSGSDRDRLSGLPTCPDNPVFQINLWASGKAQERQQPGLGWNISGEWGLKGRGELSRLGQNPEEPEGILGEELVPALLGSRHGRRA